MSTVSPTIPVEFGALKQALRTGLETNSSRIYWWPILPDISANEMYSEYPDVVGAAERLHEILKEPLLNKSTQSSFSDEKNTEFVTGITKMLLHILKANRKIDQSEVPYIEPFIRIVCNIIRRIDVSYLMLGSMLNDREKYYSPGRVGHHIMLFTFRELLEGHMPKTFLSLTQIGALDDKYLNLLFVDFFVELLPERVVLRMIDSFLLEGVKILYRYGVALIHGYKAQLKARQYPTAKAFWLSIKADAIAVSTAENNSVMLFKTLGSEEGLPPVDPFLLFEHAKNQEFLQSDLMYAYAFDTARSVQDKFLRPLNISRSNIAALKQAAAKEAPSAQLETTVSSTAVTRKSSMTEIMFDGQQNAHASGNLDIKTGNLGRKSSVRGSVSNNNSPNNSPVKNGSISSPTSLLFAASSDDTPSGAAPSSVSQDVSSSSVANTTDDVDVQLAASLMATKSSIVNQQQAQFLLSRIPLTSVMEGLELQYTTQLHGFDLSSLYSHSTGLAPCLLLVQLLAPYEHVVLGCYIGGALSPPSQQTKGDGSSRIFRLDAHHQTSFGWKGLGSSKDTTKDESAAAVPSSSSTFNQFAIGSESYIAIGGSHAHGTNALRLDESLRFLDTGHSDTYDNEALLERDVDSSESHAKHRSHRFEVRQVELWCGSFSIRRAERHGTLEVNNKASILSTD